jgi:hypothetical protein
MLGPHTTKLLEDISTPINAEKFFWAAYSKCGTPRLVVWADDQGGGLMAQMMANHWDLQCCCGGCFGRGNHFAKRMTAQQIKDLGFPLLT